MSAVDIAGFLAPLGDPPCGGNLEYDPIFLELETVARGKPEQQFGDTKVEAEEPDWREVNNLATDLLERTKDLRVAMHFLHAQLVINGLPGLSSGLELVAGYLSQFWDTLHPQLDPEDDNDPTTRLNTLAAICDPLGLLRALRKVPLTRSRQLGMISFRDYQVATGAQESADGGSPVDIRLVDGAFADTDQGFLRTQSDALGAALGHLAEIDTALAGALGAGYNLDLKPLRKLLSDIKKLVDGKLGNVAPAGEAVAGEEAGEPGAGAAPGGGAVAVSAPGQIRNRSDVLAALDKICQYYALNEPSHPLPLLLERAKRIVTMDFMSILRDLAPDGLTNFRNVAGLSDE